MPGYEVRGNRSPTVQGWPQWPATHPSSPVRPLAPRPSGVGVDRVPCGLLSTQPERGEHTRNRPTRKHERPATSLRRAAKRGELAPGMRSCAFPEIPTTCRIVWRCTPTDHPPGGEPTQEGAVSPIDPLRDDGGGSSARGWWGSCRRLPGSPTVTPGHRSGAPVRGTTGHLPIRPHPTHPWVKQTSEKHQVFKTKGKQEPSQRTECAHSQSKQSFPGVIVRGPHHAI